MEEAIQTIPVGGQGLMAEGALNTGESGKEVIESRFGPVEVDREQAIFFPKGMLGLAPELHFCLTDFPKEGYEEFKLLQCLNDYDVSFVVLPFDYDNHFIEESDMKSACEFLSLEKKEMVGLVILSVAKTPESISITGNLRAPLLIDAEQKLGVQYVFPNNKYEIAQKLN